MDFFETLKVLRRRWYVVVPLLVLTVFATLTVYSKSGAQYRAKSSFVLLPPTAKPGSAAPDVEAAALCDRNLFCRSGSIQSLGNIVTQAMADDSRATDILAKHPGATFQVLFPDNLSPIVESNVTANSSTNALATLSDVTAAIKTELAARQGVLGIPAAAFVVADPVTVARGTTVSSGGKQRAAFLTLGLGLALTLGAAYMFEGSARGRAARKQAEEDAENDQEGTGLRPTRAPGAGGRPTMLPKKPAAVSGPAP